MSFEVGELVFDQSGHCLVVSSGTSTDTATLHLSSGTATTYPNQQLSPPPFRTVVDVDEFGVVYFGAFDGSIVDYRRIPITCVGIVRSHYGLDKPKAETAIDRPDWRAEKMAAAAAQQAQMMLEMQVQRHNILRDAGIMKEIYGDLSRLSGTVMVPMRPDAWTAAPPKHETATEMTMRNRAMMPRIASAEQQALQTIMTVAHSILEAQAAAALTTAAQYASAKPPLLSRALDLPVTDLSHRHACEALRFAEVQP